MLIVRPPTCFDVPIHAFWTSGSCFILNFKGYLLAYGVLCCHRQISHPYPVKWVVSQILWLPQVCRQDDSTFRKECFFRVHLLPRLAASLSLAHHICGCWPYYPLFVLVFVEHAFDCPSSVPWGSEPHLLEGACSGHWPSGALQYWIPLAGQPWRRGAWEPSPCCFVSRSY